MPSDDDGAEERALTPSAAQPPATLPLGQSSTLDVSMLSEEQRQSLAMDLARNRIDNQRRAEELAIDARALEENLRTMADSTRNVSTSGDAITISHTQNSATGRTEILMGNTERAASGKLTKSQTGERDWTPIYIIGGIIALALVGLAYAGGG